MKANDCFAMSKNSPWTLPGDRGKPSNVATCYVMRDLPFKKMKEYGLCGNKGCPFYKKTRSEVRTD